MINSLRKLSQKFNNRFFLVEELKRLKNGIDPHVYRDLLAKSIKSPSKAEDWIPLQRFFRDCNPLVLVDIGANIGEFSRDFAAYLPVKKVYCYEPVPETFEILKRNLNKQSFSNSSFNKAVCLQHSELDFNIYQSSTLNSFCEYRDELIESGERPRPISSIKVKAGPVTNSEIQLSGKIFLKIDVQGMEKEVVGACHEILGRCVGVLLEASFIPEYEGEAPSFSSVTAYLEKYDLYPVFFQSYGDSTSLYAIERDVLFVHKDYLARAFD